MTIRLTCTGNDNYDTWKHVFMAWIIHDLRIRNKCFSCSIKHII